MSKILLGMDEGGGRGLAGFLRAWKCESTRQRRWGFDAACARLKEIIIHAERQQAQTKRWDVQKGLEVFLIWKKNQNYMKIIFKSPVVPFSSIKAHHFLEWKKQVKCVRITARIGDADRKISVGEVQTEGRICSGLCGNVILSLPHNDLWITNKSGQSMINSLLTKSSAGMLAHGTGTRKLGDQKVSLSEGGNFAMELSSRKNYLLQWKWHHHYNDQNDHIY